MGPLKIRAGADSDSVASQDPLPLLVLPGCDSMGEDCLVLLELDVPGRGGTQIGLPFSEEKG